MSFMRRLAKPRENQSPPKTGLMATALSKNSITLGHCSRSSARRASARIGAAILCPLSSHAFHRCASSRVASPRATQRTGFSGSSSSFSRARNSALRRRSSLEQHLMMLSQSCTSSYSLSAVRNIVRSMHSAAYSRRSDHTGGQCTAKAYLESARYHVGRSFMAVSARKCSVKSCSCRKERWATRLRPYSTRARTSSSMARRA
mmetsp:Transcript_44635/g.137762  ORF Transcript_44635/g.137762 Transcript_44635/m.137762 type:complete len:203 (-) Transcript_44635:953-1561(-)